MRAVIRAFSAGEVPSRAGTCANALVARIATAQAATNVKILVITLPHLFSKLSVLRPVFSLGDFDRQEKQYNLQAEWTLRRGRRPSTRLPVERHAIQHLPAPRHIPRPIRGTKRRGFLPKAPAGWLPARVFGYRCAPCARTRAPVHRRSIFVRRRRDRAAASSRRMQPRLVRLLWRWPAPACPRRR